MDVLFKNFSYDIDQHSPVLEDVSRIVQYDEDGNELVSYLPIDYPKIQASFGSVLDWSLDALLKAGINPNFPIHTGLNTRLEGVDVVAQYAAFAEDVLNSENESNK